jgi:hypothetical protein
VHYTARTPTPGRRREAFVVSIDSARSVPKVVHIFPTDC